MLTPELERLAQTPTLLVALDFDGTLAPLVDVPSDSRMTPAAREAIDRLAALPQTHVALVSGRMLGDLRLVSEAAPDSAILLAGSHGAEFDLPPGHAPIVARVPSGQVAVRTREVETALAGLDGVWVEHKPFGFVVHTRLANEDNTELAGEILDRFASEHLAGWRARGGHDVSEFSERAEGKDGAVRALRSAVHATAVLFAGDDETDEDALAALAANDVGVRVGGGVTSASFRVANAHEMAEVLAQLADARTNFRSA